MINRIKFKRLISILLAGLVLVFMNFESDAYPNKTVDLPEPLIWNIWPIQAPGNAKDLSPEYDTTKPDGELIAGKRVIRITNVSVPQIAIYKPEASIDTKTAVIIAPGGGHYILAYDLEGTEIAEWLTQLGITAIILKYRVPGQNWNPDKRWLAAAQDGQRAMSVVRGRADEIGISPDKIGIMGFSAGGTPVKYTALTSERLYDPVDQYDSISFRPDFAAPIYAGGLPKEAELNADCPPFFMVVTSDDYSPVGTAEMYISLKKAKISAEIHIYESGGHGYGLRSTELPVTSWTDRMEDWMRQLKLLER